MFCCLDQILFVLLELLFDSSQLVTLFLVLGFVLFGLLLEINVIVFHYMDLLLKKFLINGEFFLQFFDGTIAVLILASLSILLIESGMNNVFLLQPIPLQLDLIQHIFDLTDFLYLRFYLRKIVILYALYLLLLLPFCTVNVDLCLFIQLVQHLLCLHLTHL